MKKVDIFALLCVLCSFVISPCQAITITVKSDGTGDWPTIQAAIDAANDGDVVELQPGTYKGTGNRNVDFKGKPITVRGTDPNAPSIIASTVIDCENNGLGVKFKSGEEQESLLLGLTITKANSSGIYIDASSPTIKQCRIINNTRYPYGGGICIADGGSPIISNCTISNNSAKFGGGICYEGDSSLNSFMPVGMEGEYISKAIVEMVIDRMPSLTIVQLQAILQVTIVVD